MALYLWLHLGMKLWQAALVAILPSGAMACARIWDQDHTLQQTLGGVVWGACHLATLSGSISDPKCERTSRYGHLVGLDRPATSRHLGVVSSAALGPGGPVLRGRPADLHQASAAAKSR